MTHLARCAFGISGAAALLTGCGASQSPSVPTGAAPTNAIARGAYARTLLYLYLGSVNIYTYPRLKALGSLGVGGDLCSDKFGNVVVSGAAGTSQVWVYPHGGGKPIAHMYNPDSPGGCSVDPTTESIAVAAPFSSNSVVIWPYNPKRGWRLSRLYTDPNMQGTAYCAYDAQGNLFIDGYTYKGAFILAELPKGSSTFTTITLDRSIVRPGAMQWYGKYLAIEDDNQSKVSPAVISRFAISGSSGHRVGVTKLMLGVANGQFLIIGRVIVIGPERYNSGAWGLGFWHFPSGGAPFKTMSTYAQPYAEALSPK